MTQNAFKRDVVTYEEGGNLLSSTKKQSKML